ncbi:unnamed protein product [Urochloa decumbens]|uniref:Uncharacterized protein n=1 Tax=Urochloa decumbens TaxID=240449 RepID=A0ABC9B9G4_9POAL
MSSSRRLSGLRRRRRERRQRRAARDCADGLPADVLLAILHRLGHIAGGASLWRRITMRGHEGIARKINRCGTACEAVRRAAGQCEAFCGKYAGDDGFLVYLSEQCPSLRSLCLISCNDVTDEGFAEVLQAFPLLEELELLRCCNIGADGVYELAGEVCPQLKHFRLNKQSFNNKDNNMDKDALGIASMHGLHSLQLFGNVISNKGIETILDNCMHLEYLDIRHCFNVDMNEILLAKGENFSDQSKYTLRGSRPKERACKKARTSS